MGAGILAAIAGGLGESSFEGGVTTVRTGLLTGTMSGYQRWQLQQAATIFERGSIPLGSGYGGRADVITPGPESVPRFSSTGRLLEPETFVAAQQANEEAAILAAQVATTPC